MNPFTVIGRQLYKAGLKSVQVLTLCLLGVLTICSLFWGYYAEEMETQASIAHNEPFLLYLPCMLILILPLILLLRFFHAHNTRMEIKKQCYLGIALCWICICGIFLILFGRSIPFADSASVFSIAEALASGHTQVIHPTDSYLSYYPQQIGLIAFYEIILRIWNLFGITYSASYIIQCANVGMACLIVFFQYSATRLLFHDSDSACISYIYLVMLNAPLIVYTSFVYGEIPSFAFLSGGLWLLLKYLKSDRTDSVKGWLQMAGCLMMLTVAVALRKNSLIVIIAAILVLLWEWLISRRHRLLLFGILLTLCSVNVLPGIQHIYEQRAGNTLSSGVPAISYIAMGMQESSRGNGWYNGFNFYTYQDSHLDTAVTAAKSKEAISASLAAFRADPGYAFRFYRDKFLSQWTDGSYFCRQATQTHTNARKEIIESLYSGELSKPFIHYCNIYQLLIYACAFLCLLSKWRHRKTNGVRLPFYIGVIAVLGGFLFHMMWEANSRYILPYFLLLLPYSAMGLGTVAERLLRKGDFHENTIQKY